MQADVVYTIGHSTRTQQEFLDVLSTYQIEVVADIRRYPGSRRYPHFNRPNLQAALAEKNIGYEHFEALGGRRKPVADSPNHAWKNPAFRGYADHMATPEFRHAIENLMKIAGEKRLAYMCAEAPWWRCHRALISDYLKTKGWTVMHILSKASLAEHPFTSPAQVSQGKLFYDE